MDEVKHTLLLVLLCLRAGRENEFASLVWQRSSMICWPQTTTYGCLNSPCRLPNLIW
jgi:hypothetical protein